MKWITIVIILAFNVSAAQDAKSIFEKANATMKSLRSIEMNVSYTDNYSGQISGDLVILRDQKTYPVFGVSKFKMTGIALTPDGSKTLSMAFNGDTYAYLDGANNEIVVIENPTYSKIGRTKSLMYSMAIPAAYYEGAAFDSLIQNIVKYELVEDTTIFQQPAYTVRITRNVYNKFNGETTQASTEFYIHKESYLLLGNSSKWSKTYIKIRSVNKNYETDFFSLTGNNAAKQIIQEVNAPEYLSLNTVAPDWTLPSNKSKEISLKDLKGKVVMLDFWGTWCAPCLKSMPAVQSIYENFKNQPVEVIGVSVEMEDAIDVPKYVKTKGYTYPIALNGKLIAKDYKVTQYPTIYIIDKKGRIIFAGPGEELQKNKEVIIQLIQKALDGQAVATSNNELSIRKTDGNEPLTEGLLIPGSIAPLWKLPSNKSNPIDLEKLKGKVVLLDFWGTWCMPCIKAMPDIQAISEHFKGKPVEVIGVSVELNKTADPSAFAQSKGFTYTIALNGQEITKQYQVLTYPTVYIIDKEGKVFHAEHTSGRENFKTDIIQRIESALKK